MLTRQRVVMHHSLLAAPIRGLEGFTEVLDEPGHARTATLSLADYVDMGSPKTITVTIEPLLNAR